MPAYDMNHTNVNNCLFYTDAPGTPSFELTKSMIEDSNKAGYQEVIVSHNQSFTTLHQIMKRKLTDSGMHWRDINRAVTMWAGSFHPLNWPWEVNARRWMASRVADPNVNWNDFILTRPSEKRLTLGSLWPMANWQMHNVGELGAKSYVTREKLNAAAHAVFLLDPDINNPVPGFMDCGEAGKGKSYKLKLVESMLFPGQVRTVHRASACSTDEDVGQEILNHHEALPEAMNKSTSKTDNDKARANFKASLTERKFSIKTKDAKTRSVYTENFINLGVPFMCMNESEDKIEPAVLDRFLRVISGFENTGKHARAASKLTIQANSAGSKENMTCFHDCTRIRMAIFNVINADEAFNQSPLDNELFAWVLTKWQDAMPSFAGGAGASPRWTNHVATYARVFTIQSLVSFVQLGLTTPPEGLVDILESLLDQDDNSSEQWAAVQDIKALAQPHEDYLDHLGTPGCKLVLEGINIALTDAIFYGFATLVDGSTTRRDKETIEGIKEAIYNREENEGDYIKMPCGLEALVGDVVTVLNNRNIKREAKTIFGAISEIQNRLVGKNEKSKTQAMITHNPRHVIVFFNLAVFAILTQYITNREVLVNKNLCGERLTPKEKKMLYAVAQKTWCKAPALYDGDIQHALSGHKYRKIDWTHWVDCKEPDIDAVSCHSFVKVHPDHLVINCLHPDGGLDMSKYTGFVYVSDKLFQMASDEEHNAADMSVGFSRLLKLFNTPDEWGNIVIPAHPHDDTVEFALVNTKTDMTMRPTPASMRRMENANYVPAKRRKLLPMVVQNAINRQENKKFAVIKEGVDFQSLVAKKHLINSTLGKMLARGPAPAGPLIDAISDKWLSPLAVQRALNAMV